MRYIAQGFGLNSYHTSALWLPSHGLVLRAFSETNLIWVCLRQAISLNEWSLRTAYYNTSERSQWQGQRDNGSTHGQAQDNT